MFIIMEKFEKLDRKIRDKKVWKQDEVFEAIWNDKIEKFFENYKKFDEFLVTKDKNALIYSGHVFLDAEVSWKLHSDFREAFENSIKWIVGENIFERMRIFLEEKDYLLSYEHKRLDSDPFLDDKFQTIVLWNNTVAQFFENKIIAQLVERRNNFNNVEFHYIIYPNRIFKFINNLCNKHHLKI